LALIRALTFFIPIKEEDSYIKLFEESFNKASKIIGDIDLSPWTIRFVIPPLSNKIIKHFIRDLDKIYDIISQDKYLVNLLPLYSSSKYIKDIPSLLQEYGKLYSTIYLKKIRDVDLIIRDIYMKNAEPDIFTRISITNFKWIQTPYFPSTANIENKFGFSIALRYVDLFNNYFSGDIEIISFLKDIKSKIDRYYNYFKGIDFSLSPWMDESVAKLIEDNYKIKIGELGSFYAVYSVNTKIKEIISLDIVNSIGYNEVMLPVGEDNILKKRVEDGTLNLRTLISLSSICVAGVDMIAIKRDEELIKKLIMDINSFSLMKQRTLGIRIIPVEDGDKVYSKRFGYIPVINP